VIRAAQGCSGGGHRWRQCCCACNRCQHPAASPTQGSPRLIDLQILIMLNMLLAPGVPLAARDFRPFSHFPNRNWHVGKPVRG
jgi:hypothetical protein